MKLWALYVYIDDGYHVMDQLFEAEQDAQDKAGEPNNELEPRYVRAVYTTPPLKRADTYERCDNNEHWREKPPSQRKGEASWWCQVCWKRLPGWWLPKVTDLRRRPDHPPV